MVSKEYLQEINEYKRLLQSKYEHIPNQSGIYVFQREENGIKFAYVGQSKYLLNRLAEHLRGYKTRNPSHIDLSIKKHGLRSFDNPTGYDIVFWQVPEDRLNDEERYYINLYANAGYQLRNKTLGGQDKGKVDIAERKPTKTYRDGLKQGEINTLRLVKKYFDKYLNYSIKEPCNAVKTRKLEKFEEMLWRIDNGGTKDVCENDS